MDAGSASVGDTLTVSVDISNTGKLAGDEVPQLYVQHLGSKVERPVLDLRGYARVTLKPGETKTVSFRVPVSSLAYWDSANHMWVVESEKVQLDVGASSKDIRLKRTVDIISR